MPKFASPQLRHKLPLCGKTTAVRHGDVRRSPGPCIRWSTLGNEGPRRCQAGGRLQRQDPRQVRRLGRRTRQRQDVDEPLRRDRRRRSGAAQGEGAGPGDRRRLHRSQQSRRRRSAPRCRWAPIAACWSRRRKDRWSSRWRSQSCSRRWWRPKSPASSSWASRPSTTTATRPAKCWRRCWAGRRRPSPPRS